MTFADINHPHSWYLASLADRRAAQQYADRTRVTQAIHVHPPETECEVGCTTITPRDSR